MPKRKKGPRQGDFVLWEAEIWEIRKVKKKTVIMESSDIEYEEELLINSLVSSDIKVWDTEGEPIEDQEEY